MILATYATFEEMHGRKSTLDELIERLEIYSRESVLYICSVTGIILKLWQRGGWAKENYFALIDSAFGDIRGDYYKYALEKADAEMVFHRRQLLFLSKLAIEHCAERGLDLLKARPGLFGTILLMANDHFHFGTYPNPKIDERDQYDKISRIAAEFIPVNEYSGFRVQCKLVRSHLMMTRYSEQLKGHQDYINILEQYERLTGIPFLDHEALTFGLMTRMTELITLKGLQADGWIAAIQPQNFYTTAITQETIGKFLNEVSATPEGLLGDIQTARKSKKDFGANDFTVFRKKPVIKEGYGYLAADVMYAVEKLESGPYWRVSAIDKATGDKLRRFWGPVFEGYVNDLIKAFSPMFIADPRLIGNANEQLCDGLLVEGDALVVMEYKASMFTAEAKYSGNHVTLRDEITKKLVRDAEEDNKKGVEQLAAAISTLFADPRKPMVPGLDVSGVKHVYPLLITLDDLGSSLLISKLLNFSFDAVFKRDAFQSVEVKPLLCTDIESIEVVIPHVVDRPLSYFLQYWLDHDPKLLATFLAQFPEGLPERNAFIDKHWKKLSRAISSRLFPREAAEAEGNA